ncbi:conjugal transfer pilus assembly protein TraW [mine drainage metagenome]|uniref:Conjugal transfer pilus assembly protein TraW n=3 Tax=mine drainage metagenome TaxID=410659 RepID=T1B564_9ZZZZ
MNTRGALLIATALALLSPPGLSRATNLGVQGMTWPIIEIDMRKFLAEQAAHVNWSHVENRLTHSAHHYLETLPRRDIPTINSTTTRWIDPSIILSRNILVPKKSAKGQWHWVVLYRKGTRFNPLSVERPIQAMLFFDSASRVQRTFVRAALRKYPDRIMPVDIDGNDPQPLSKSWGQPVFEATNAMLARFPVFAIPALLYPGSGAEHLRLGMTAFGPPYSTSQLAVAWPQLAPRTVPSSQETDHVRAP